MLNGSPIGYMYCQWAGFRKVNNNITIYFLAYLLHVTVISISLSLPLLGLVGLESFVELDESSRRRASNSRFVLANVTSNLLHLRQSQLRSQGGFVP